MLPSASIKPDINHKKLSSLIHGGNTPVLLSKNMKLFKSISADNLHILYLLLNLQFTLPYFLKRDLNRIVNFLCVVCVMALNVNFDFLKTCTSPITNP